MIAPSNLFSFLIKTLNNLTEGFRIFVTASAIGMYGLVLYEAFPHLLFDINNAVFYFMIPAGSIAGILIGVPKFLAKGTSVPKAKATAEADPLEELIGDAAPITESGEENADIGKIGGENAELEALLAGGGETPSDTVTTEPIPQFEAAPAFDESRIRELIDQKFEPVEKDLTTFKKDLNKIKEDMKVTKESVDTLTESFEGTLTDMKAFQAEISNPLNFMRKYFEALDLSNLSDPSLPLKQGILNSQNSISQNNNFQPPQAPPVQQPPPQIPVMVHAAPGNYEQPQQMPPQQLNPQQLNPRPPSQPITKGSEMDNLIKGTDLEGPMDSVMKPLFKGNLSVANMMAIIELVGEMFQEKGDDCIDLLIEQCKLMGLKSEDENTIYNIIDMLKNSNMSVEDSIDQLYKFAKIVGLNDKESDAYYSRLKAHKSSGGRD